MTPEERQKLIDDIAHVVTEQLYRSLPEIVGNMARTVQSHAERFTQFYEKYPEFRDHTEIVGQTISKIEGRDPLRPYDEMIELAVPEIRKAIEAKNTIDMEPVESYQVDRKFTENLGKL